MLNNFGSIYFPYGIYGNNDDGWVVFNREYRPLGVSERGDHSWIYDNSKTIKFKLPGKLIEKLSLTIDGDSTLVINGENKQFWLYKDNSNPWNSSDVVLYDIYFKKLKLLSKIKKIKDDE